MRSRWIVCAEAFLERVRLLRGEREARLFLPPFDGLARVYRSEARQGVSYSPYMRGRLALGPPKRAQVDAARGGGVVPFCPCGVCVLRGAVALRDYAAFGNFLLKRFAKNLGRYFGEFVCVKKQVILESPAMPRVLCLSLERVGNRRACAKGRILRDADGERDAVCGRKADAPDVAAELVGVGLYDCYCVWTVFADDLRHLRYRDAVGLAEDHVLPKRLVCVPACSYLLDLRLAELWHFDEPRRLVGEDVQGVFAEGFDDALCEDFADALYEPRGEIALDADEGPRRDAGDCLGLELASVDFVRHPRAGCGNLLAFPYRLRLADDGYLV